LDGRYRRGARKTMDRADPNLDNPHLMPATARTPAIPAFSLYGEQEGAPLGGWLHCESIPARSGRYDWEIKPHRHQRLFQLLHLSGGSGECLLEGALAPLAPGAAVAIPAGAVHGYRFSPDVDGWVLTVMQPKALEAMQILPDRGDRFGVPQVIPLPEGAALPAVASAFRIIDAELASARPGGDMLIEAQLATLLVLVARALGPGRSGAGVASPLHRHAERFRDLINAHFRTERSARFYARELGLSETHLNRVCRTALGCSALAAIHDRILAEASRDLAFTTMSVAEIGHSLGFEDPAYFSRFFTRAAGLSPRRFRQRAAGAG
jgi:AraC family transcriptional activator of pobA